MGDKEGKPTAETQEVVEIEMIQQGSQRQKDDFKQVASMRAFSRSEVGLSLKSFIWKVT